LREGCAGKEWEEQEYKMISNKSDLAHERPRRRGVIGAILSAVALSAILSAAPAMAQTPAPTQHVAPAMQDVATPVQPLPVPPAQALPATSSPDPIAKPASEPAIEEANRVPRTNGLLFATLPQDLSPWGMFLNAVLPAKIVMVIASLAAWTVMLAKIIELWAANRSARSGLEILAHATSLHGAEKEFGQTKSPVSRLVAAAVGEADRSEGLAAEGIEDRAATLLSRLEAQRARAISRELGTLRRSAP
jgi:biopolymer transport protein ExbB